MRTLRGMPIAFLLAGCAWLVACSSAPPKPQVVKLTFAVSADVNPDAQNRPSPVVVRLYQLKDDAAFKDADIFTLLDKEQARRQCKELYAWLRSLYGAKVTS